MDTVSAYFAKACEDWTALLAASEAVALFCPHSKDAHATELCKAVLSEIELEAANSFITPKLSSAFIQRRAFQRYCVSIILEIPIEQIDRHWRSTDKGGPYLKESPEYSLSFSSCEQGFVGAWSDTHSVGIDMEDTSKSIEVLEVANQFFSGCEVQLIEEEPDEKERLRTFFQLWCLKEAALKSIGEGMPFGLEKFQFELHPTPRMINSPPTFTAIEKSNSHVFLTERLVAAFVSHC